ncbi:mycofactocin-coupled SDR family oxidoreductase [Modestobacter altitudinis]|uniref:mycofactocin-coupled SDR family oxidoreductase n=1 Tax=Modestobacter altitudinis TaxID=2213158 RepID=UPI00110D1D82|nr:mycofactocin-coupled SDR family oxidoreductase [Modestobacter altitudinis]
MAGRVEGKVAFITGAARNQGRSHALRLAQEGADIIAVDIAGPVESIQMYPPATEEDLAETVRQVEALDRRIVATKADVRDSGALKAAVDDGVAQLGRLDIVLGNAGVFEIQPALELTDDAWREMIDINLTGVWNTCKAALPHLVEGGRGGAIVLTSSTAGLKGTPNTIHYTAAKHGVVGIMRTLANEFAAHSIRVNSVHPTGVDTVMIQNQKTWGLFAPDDPAPSREKAEPIFQSTNALPIPWVEPVDISNAILFLVSDEARYITGVTLPVDAGYTVQ